MIEFRPGGEEGTLEMFQDGRSQGLVRGYSGYVEGKTTTDDVIASLMYDDLDASFDIFDYVGFVIGGSPQRVSWSNPQD